MHARIFLLWSQTIVYLGFAGGKPTYSRPLLRSARTTTAPLLARETHAAIRSACGALTIGNRVKSSYLKSKIG